jgi:hypothetical protein
MQKQLKPKSCPCCGENSPFTVKGRRPKNAMELSIRLCSRSNIIGLYIGHLSSNMMGVMCYSCGLTLGRNDFNANIAKGESCGEYDRRLLNLAIEAWNRRSGH